MIPVKAIFAIIECPSELLILGAFILAIWAGVLLWIAFTYAVLARPRGNFFSLICRGEAS
jgi:uncharacterized membrane protein YvlD (DUF360 family)